MKHLDPELKALLVGRLRERRAAGELTSAGVREAAAGIGVAERTLWGWLAGYVPKPDGRPGRGRSSHRHTNADSPTPGARWLPCCSD